MGGEVIDLSHVAYLMAFACTVQHAFNFVSAWSHACERTRSWTPVGHLAYPPLAMHLQL